MAQTNTPAKAGADDFSSPEGVKILLKRAAKGDRDTIPPMRALFDGMPELRAMFDVGTLAKDALVESLSGKNPVYADLTKRRMEAIADQLAGPNPTQIERLLADRAAFCWHVVYQYERSYASCGEITLKQAAYHQARIDAAHRRYLSALKTLATVRKLALPAIQVNIGENQVNVAGS